MGLHSKKKSEKPNDESGTKDNVEKSMVNERPRICCIDIDEKVIEQLRKSKLNIYSGTFGSKINVPNSTRRENHRLTLVYDFPPNLHEYDIIIIDLNHFNTIDYNSEDHVQNKITGRRAYSLLSSFPETVFDPRPLCSSILNEKMGGITNRDHIIIAFTASSYSIDYQTIEITEDYVERQQIVSYNIYDFLGHTPLSESMYGEQMTVCNIRGDLKNLLEKNLDKTFYNQTFHHPTIWDNGKNTPDQNFVPLIRNLNDDIVSICEFRTSSTVFFFPQIEAKGDFLDSFLNRIAPDISPELFPFSTTYRWKDHQEYWLPNQEKLLEEKKAIKKDYEAKRKSKDVELSKNSVKFSFLHEILTETGDKLVDALIVYLKWLGFEKVTKVDEANPDSTFLEEDIRIETDKGLLIIECKGIGGTSTDSDCSQISKIKLRRCKDRGNFDVFALYIVNHQRYLPPLSRKNPPFSQNQKQDAVNDERGLLSTWQLFNLYYEIESGILDKESARNDLFNYGFIEFRPPNLKLIDEPQEFFGSGKVCIVNTTDVELNLGDELLIERNGKFIKTIIEGIQIDGKPVASANSGELGLQLSNPIKKKSKLWQRIVTKY
jgi:hypothetical protein